MIHGIDEVSLLVYQMVLAEIGSDGCLRTLFDNQPIKNFHDASNIYAIETPSAEMSADSSSSVMIVAINVLVEFDELHLYQVTVRITICCIFSWKNFLL